MYKNYDIATGMDALEAEAKRYADKVYCEFDFYRNAGFRLFNGKHFPRYVCVCKDDNETMLGENYSHRPSMKEYKKTQMLSEMGQQFSLTGTISHWEDLRTYSRQNFPIGQCAEQHAANDLLKGLNMRKNIKKDIQFSRPIRPATGEDFFGYCQNCKELFDI